MIQQTSQKVRFLNKLPGNTPDSNETSQLWNDHHPYLQNTRTHTTRADTIQKISSLTHEAEPMRSGKRANAAPLVVPPEKESTSWQQGLYMGRGGRSEKRRKGPKRKL
jgi:hypothetical protein